MRISLIAVDGHGGFPNLALMRLSTWHKQRGDAVEWWNGFTHYDRVYKSKVFTFTPDFNTVINADEIVTGGTGYWNRMSQAECARELGVSQQAVSYMETKILRKLRVYLS